MVKIILQPVEPSNHYLYLQELLASISQSKPCYYLQELQVTHSPSNRLYIDKNNMLGGFPKSIIECLNQNVSPVLNSEESKSYFLSCINIDPRIVIFGGGVDVKPMINFANELGWQVHIVEYHPKQANLNFLNKAHALHKIKPLACENEDWLNQCDAAIIMNHNLERDSESLNVLKQKKRLRYIGLLGPKHRSTQVLSLAQITEDNLPTKLYTPIGFDIGGDLPESIALSALSQIHAVLENKI
jgi:xanthine/CO dehydrogenase XdhC/CoxF family maturation factor